MAGVLASVNEAAASRAKVRDTLSRADTLALVAEVLAPTGALAARKVFTRKEVMVAATPALYGLKSSEQTRVVDAIVADGEAVPLIPTKAATERAYSTASVIATEAAVAARIDTQLFGTDAGLRGVWSSTRWIGTGDAQRSLWRLSPSCSWPWR